MSSSACWARSALRSAGSSTRGERLWRAMRRWRSASPAGELGRGDAPEHGRPGRCLEPRRATTPGSSTPQPKSSASLARAMARKSAFITGITGQDGSYLAELLLERDYDVHGMVRRASTEKFDRIEHIRERITLHQGDLLDQRSLVDALRAARPDEIYNLAA